MPLNDERVAGQLLHLRIGNRKPLALGLIHIHCFHRTAEFMTGCELHLDELGAEVAPQNCSLALRQRGFINVELVRIHRALALPFHPDRRKP